jgi:hypothetical protein
MHPFIRPSIAIFLLTAALYGGVGVVFAQTTRMLYTDSTGTNIGIGTTTPQAAFVVTNGNVGIGTWTADGGRLIVLGGNVGIGTTLPVHKADIVAASSDTVSGLRVSSSGWGSVSNPMVLFDTGAAGDGRVLRVKNNGARTDLSLFDIVNSGGTVFYIQGNGNVGIGTTVPSTLLDLGSGSSSNRQVFVAGNETTGSLAIYTDSQGPNYNVSNCATGYVLCVGSRGGSPYKSAYFVGQVIMGVENGGSQIANVGIGTTVPASKLHIYGVNSTIRMDSPSGAGNGPSGVEFFTEGVNKANFGLYSGLHSSTSVDVELQLVASQKFLVSGAGSSVQFNNYGAGTLVTDASGNITASSDIRLKDVQGSFDRGLDAILDINPIIYKWNKLSKNDQKGIYAGFSAQNVQTVIPEAVNKAPDGYLSLQDRPIEAALVNAVKELHTRVESLEKQNITLRQRLEALEKR